MFDSGMFQRNELINAEMQLLRARTLQHLREIVFDEAPADIEEAKGEFLTRFTVVLHVIENEWRAEELFQDPAKWDDSTLSTLQIISNALLDMPDRGRGASNYDE